MTKNLAAGLWVNRQSGGGLPLQGGHDPVKHGLGIGQFIALSGLLQDVSAVAENIGHGPLMGKGRGKRDQGQEKQFRAIV